jgi:hypothetical protein
MSNRVKGFPNVKGIKKELESTKNSVQLVPGVQQPASEAGNHKIKALKMKNQPAVTVLTVRIASDFSGSCVVTFCQKGRCQLQRLIQISAFCACNVCLP